MKIRFISTISTCALWISLSAAPWSFGATVVQNFDFLGIGNTVPDGTGSGLTDLRSVSSSILNITDITVNLHLSGGTAPGFTGINGDLYAQLQHSSGFAVLINRPGMDDTHPFGYLDPGGINAAFNDTGVNGDIHYYQDEGLFANSGPLNGLFQPDGRSIDSLFNSPAAVAAEPRMAMLSTFNGLVASGSWTLYVEDLFGDGSNFILESWSLTLTGEDTTATVPEPRTAIPLVLLIATGIMRSRLPHKKRARRSGPSS